MFPKEKSYKLLIQQSIQQLRLASEHIEIIRKEMNELASTLPEYETVMSMYGVGETYGPQLIAEFGMYLVLHIEKLSPHLPVLILV